MKCPVGTSQASIVVKKIWLASKINLNLRLKEAERQTHFKLTLKSPNPTPSRFFFVSCLVQQFLVLCIFLNDRTDYSCSTDRLNGLQPTLEEFANS